VPEFREKFDFRVSHAAGQAYARGFPHPLFCMPRPFAILLALSAAGIAQEKTTYDDHVFPLFQQSCLNCHNPDKAKGGLDLSSYTATLKGGSGGKIVEPGDAGSKLIALVLQTAEPKMPPEGDPLASSAVDLLKRWIDGGLLENKSSSARKATKPKFETALRSDPAAKPDEPPPMPEHLLLEPAVVTTRPAAIHAIASSPWAPLLAVTGQRQIQLHHTETLDLVGILPFPEGDPVSLAFTPEGRYLIVGGGVPGKSGITVTFDVTTGSRLLGAGKEFDSILAADIRPGFDLVATGGPSKLLKIWNTETGELVKSVKKHTDWITTLDLSNDGVLLASGDRNGGVWVWESETANEFHTLRGHQAGISAVVFRADSNLLATSSEDGTVRFWEMNGGGEVKKNDAHPGGVTAFAFGRDGSSVTAGRDMKAKLWKPDFNHARDLAQNLPNLPTAVALDAEGKRAFIADAQGIIRVYQTSDSAALGEIQANPPTIETRIQAINQEISSQELVLATAGKTHADSTAARDQARHTLGEAEKTLQQAIEIHKAAQAGAEQSPGEASAKIAADALARIAPAEQALAQQRATLEAAEKNAAEAAAALEKARPTLAALHAAAKRWNAAAINTRALATRRQAEESRLALEETHLDFTRSAATLATRAEALNAKRDERDRFASHSQTTHQSPAIAAEIQATLAAIDVRIAAEQASLTAAENDTLRVRDSVEHSAPLVHGSGQESAALRAAYLKALE
jgi:Planctomycete cytochrome C/WD domain, G-beta repeat